MINKSYTNKYIELVSSKPTQIQCSRHRVHKKARTRILYLKERSFRNIKRQRKADDEQYIFSQSSVKTRSV